MAKAMPVTEARIWCLERYRRNREGGDTPLQAMFEVYCYATTAVDVESTMTTEWRKHYSRRYFGIITQRGAYWVRGALDAIPAG